MDTPDSIHHHIICTAELNPESDKLDKHCTTELQSPRFWFLLLLSEQMKELQRSLS